MKLIDLTIRMYTEPKIELNKGLLLRHLHKVKEAKEKLLASVAVDKELLMSNPKFAELLIEQGVTPPMKISATTGKETYAFAVNLQGANGMLYGSYAMNRPETAMAFDGIQKAFLRSRANTIEGGTTEVMKNILGERVLGLPGDVRVDREIAWNKVARN